MRQIALREPREAIARHASARLLARRGSQAFEIAVEIGVGDFRDLAPLKRLDAGVDLQAQRPELERVLAPALLQGAQCVAHGFAGVLVFAGFHRLRDEGVLLGGQADVAGRHAPSPAIAARLAAMAKFANPRGHDSWWMLCPPLSFRPSDPGLGPGSESRNPVI